MTSKVEENPAPGKRGRPKKVSDDSAVAKPATKKAAQKKRVMAAHPQHIQQRRNCRLLVQAD